MEFNLCFCEDLLPNRTEMSEQTEVNWYVKCSYLLLYNTSEKKWEFCFVFWTTFFLTTFIRVRSLHDWHRISQFSIHNILSLAFHLKISCSSLHLFLDSFEMLILTKSTAIGFSYFFRMFFSFFRLSSILNICFYYFSFTSLNKLISESNKTGI